MCTSKLRFSGGTEEYLSRTAHLQPTGNWSLVDLETLVAHFPRQITTEPRDIIYALLSVASNVNPTDWEAKDSKGVRQIFKEFTVTGLPFGSKGRKSYGRNHGDSLVGTPQREFYNALNGSISQIIFGKNESDVFSTATSRTPNVMRE